MNDPIDEDGPGEELEASLRLAAAAPDLLAAVLELTKGCEYKAYPCDPVPYWHVISMPTRKALDMARAAIAKATQS